MQYDEKIIPMAYPDQPKLERYCLTEDLLSSMKKPLFIDGERYVGYVVLIFVLVFLFFVGPFFVIGLDSFIIGIIASAIFGFVLVAVSFGGTNQFFEKRFEQKYKGSVDLERYENYKAYQRSMQEFEGKLKEYSLFKSTLGLSLFMNVTSYDPSTNTMVCEGSDCEQGLCWDEKLIFKDYKLHCTDQPAWIKKNPRQGKLESLKDETPQITILEAWYLNGEKHRVKGPAQIERDAETGNITTEAWCINGLQHRSDGPAVIKYNPISSKVISEVWVLHGKEHRDGGPSSLYYHLVSYARKWCMREI